MPPTYIKINVCKELTKKNETKYSGCISDIISQIDLRGEFVIIFKTKMKIMMILIHCYLK